MKVGRIMECRIRTRRIWMRTMLTLCLLALPAVSFATNHYVWCGAASNGTGADWTNALSDLPASLTRGDTYYIAGSRSCTYGAHTFNDPLSGTSVVSIIRATSANSESVAGWQASFSTAPAKWNTPMTQTGSKTFWYFQQGYYTIDGQFGNGNNAGGFGFWLQRAEADTGDNYNYIWAATTAGTALMNLTFNHIEADGITINYSSISAGAEAFVTSALPGGSYSNLTFQNDYFHDIETGGWHLNGVSNLIVDHCWLARQEYTARAHANGVGINPGTQLFTVSSMSESGTTVTATLSSTSTNWSIPSAVIITNAVPSHYNGTWTLTSISGNQIQWTAPSGLGSVTSSNACGGSGVACGYMAYAASDLTFSNSMWQDVCGSSVITNMNGTIKNEYIYGNVFWQTTLNESFDGTDLIQCNGGAGVIGDLGSTGAISTTVKIYNNTFMNNSPNGGVVFSNPSASGIDQENNFFFNSPNVRLMKASDLGGGNTDAYNTLIDGVESGFWDCGGIGDSCQNVTGPSINSNSSRTSNVASLVMNGSLNYKSGDGLVVLGSTTSSSPSAPCGLDTVYPYPRGTKTDAQHVAYILSGPDIARGRCSNGYGYVLNASATAMPFIDPVMQFNFMLSSDTADPHVNDGNNLASICGSWNPSCTIDGNGNRRPPRGAWDRGAFQSPLPNVPTNLKVTSVH